MRGGKIKNNYCIKLVFQVNKISSEKTKILNSDFIIKNKNKCKIIFKNKQYDLKKYFEDIDIHYNHKDSIIFKLLFIHDFIDISRMFYNCDTLISISDNNKKCTFKDKLYSNPLNLENYSRHMKMNIINMHDTFYGYTSLISILDYKKRQRYKLYVF